jgi:hypothetical protein
MSIDYWHGCLLYITRLPANLPFPSLTLTRLLAARMGWSIPRPGGIAY